ncbi:MAG TPA: rhomboid family intramembrane serine protease [Dongiaceae bacterium]
MNTIAEAAQGVGAGSRQDPRASDSFAAYLAQLFIAKHGYHEGTVPEARSLAAACDYIVTKSDGTGFRILCIVDAAKDPAKRFLLDRRSVREIAKTCRDKYSERVSRTRLPAVIEIVEIRNTISRQDIERLKPLKSRFYQVIAAYVVDLSNRTVARNMWSLTNSRVRMIKRALLQPRLGATELIPPPPRAEPDLQRKPVLTIAILAVLAAIFALEVEFPADGGPQSVVPSITTLVAFGGLMRNLVAQGEWYRILTGPLLHASPEHIIFNGIALWFAGSVLERLLGRAWLLALFFFGAIGGALMSLALNPPELVSIGASGAIMCLIAAVCVTAFRYPVGVQRTRIQSRMLRMLIPSLIPLAAHADGGGVDYAAHLGGALTGFALGGGLLAIWPRDLAAPRLAPLAKALALIAVVVFAGAVFEDYTGHEKYALSASLIPEQELPKTNDQIAPLSEKLVESYPKDPRSHFFRALAVMNDDPPTAEHELKTALGERQMLETEFKPDFEITLVSYLARTLVMEGRSDEARLAVKPYCRRGPNGGVPEKLVSLDFCTGE